MGTAIQVGFTPAQLEQRRSGIGASEVGAILGLDRYKTPLDIYWKKVGPVRMDDEPMSQAAKMGHLLEPIVAALAEEQYTARGLNVALQLSDTVTGAEDWMRATPDRLVLAPDAGAQWLLECKTKSWHTFKEFGAPGTDQVPDSILLQCLWQMLVTGMLHCDVAVLVDGRQFEMYHVGYDAGLAESIRERVRDFWVNYVLAGKEPPAQRASDVRYLKAQFRKVDAGLVTATPELEEAALRLALARETRVQAEDAEELAKGQIMALLGGAKGVHTRAGKVSWAEQAGRTTTDWKGIATIMGAPAELIAEHTKTGEPSRVFRFTPSKED